MTRNAEGKWLQPTPDIATTHIIKPVDSADNYFVSKIDIAEFMTLKAATLCGLKAVEPELWQSSTSDLSAVILPRYDRTIHNDSVVRIHQEDLLQALGVPPEKKYQHRDRGPGVGDIGRLFNSAVDPGARQGLREEFFKGLVFNVGVLGTDAHAKNYSLLHLPQGPELAPFYDLISAAGYITDEHQAFFPMSIKQNYKFIHMSVEDLVYEGKRLGLDTGSAEEIVERILTAIPEAFERVGQEHGYEETAARVLKGLKELSVARFVSSYWV